MHIPSGRRQGGGIRGEVTSWSPESRRRLRYALARVEWERLLLPLDVTLTYPGDWRKYAPSGEVCKGLHLQAFQRRLERVAKRRVPLAWKLEFQKRGAPHFHLLVDANDVGMRVTEFREWVALAWWEVVGSGDAGHRAAGTRVAVVRSARGLSGYWAGYVAGAKGQETPPADFKSGRWWYVPESWRGAWQETPVDGRGEAAVRRTMNRLIAKRVPGFKARPGGATVVSRGDASRTYAQLSEIGERVHERSSRGSWTVRPLSDVLNESRPYPRPSNDLGSGSP